MPNATYPSSDIKSNWSSLSRQAIREPITLTVRGKPSLVLTSVEDYQLLEKCKRERLLADINAGRADIDAGRVSKPTVEEIVAEAKSRNASAE